MKLSGHKIQAISQVGAPTISISTYTNTSITIAWTNRTEPLISYYAIWYSTSQNGTYTKANNANNTTSGPYLISGLTQGSTYYIKIAAVDTSGNIGPFSNIVSQALTTFNVSNITFTQGIAFNHDLSQYYTIPPGQSFVSLSIVQGDLDSVNSGITLNSGAEDLVYNGTGLPATRTGIVLRLTTNVGTIDSTAFTVTTNPASETLTWLSNPFPMTVAQGSYVDLTSYYLDSQSALTSITNIGTPFPSGVTIESSPSWRIVATSNATLGESGGGHQLQLNALAEADWQSRIADPGVIWYHNFDSAAEVNQFRWTGGYAGGNDPLAVGNSQSSQCEWVSSGGVDGGGFLRITRPSGSNGPLADQVNWWRPFTPLTGASNGRGVDDPAGVGAFKLRPNGSTITPQVFSPTDGSATTYNWQDNHPGAGAGWYGHSTYAASNAAFDGTDFYYQVRVKVDPNRTASGNANVGKLISHTTLKNSYTPQELVTYSADYVTAGIGVPNRHNMYDGTYDPMAGHSTGTKNPTQWAYSFGWDVLLYHVTPGRDGVANDCRLEVWAATEAAIQAQQGYTKIWDITFSTNFASAAGGWGTGFQNGWCALLAWIYQNNVVFSTSFSQSYDQIIFSKSFIACPEA